MRRRLLTYLQGLDQQFLDLAPFSDSVVGEEGLQRDLAFVLDPLVGVCRSLEELVVDLGGSVFDLLLGGAVKT